MDLLFPKELLEKLGTFKKVFVLVSGGIDSTYLWDIISTIWPDLAIPVNCYNPYEINDTLKDIAKHPRYIQIKPSEQYDYAAILKESFKKIPEARQLARHKKYHKKVFSCCYYIKHKAFLDDPVFQEPGTCVISGIKRGDGQQRRFWCIKLKKEGDKFAEETGKQCVSASYMHQHKGGQLYVYPFRDYKKRELPDNVIRELVKKYPTLRHSGCSICPVLVVFNIKSEKERYERSVRFFNNLMGYPNQVNLKAFGKEK